MLLMGFTGLEFQVLSNKEHCRLSIIKTCSLDLYSWNIVLVSLLFLEHIRHTLALGVSSKSHVFLTWLTQFLFFKSLVQFHFCNTEILSHISLPAPLMLFHFFKALVTFYSILFNLLLLSIVCLLSLSVPYHHYHVSSMTSGFLSVLFTDVAREPIPCLAHSRC